MGGAVQVASFVGDEAICRVLTIVGSTPEIVKSGLSLSEDQSGRNAKHDAEGPVVRLQRYQAAF